MGTVRNMMVASTKKIRPVNGSARMFHPELNKACECSFPEDTWGCQNLYLGQSDKFVGKQKMPRRGIL
jgi:hypothetical protein